MKLEQLVTDLISKHQELNNAMWMKPKQSSTRVFNHMADAMDEEPYAAMIAAFCAEKGITEYNLFGDGVPEYKEEGHDFTGMLEDHIWNAFN